MERIFDIFVRRIFNSRLCNIICSILYLYVFDVFVGVFRGKINSYMSGVCQKREQKQYSLYNKRSSTSVTSLHYSHQKDTVWRVCLPQNTQTYEL